MLNKEIVSELTNILRLNNKDNRLPKRFLLKLLQDSATFLISQKWGERGLVSDTNLYTYVPCLEFERIDVKECPSVEFRLCNTLMKSKKPLPKLIFSRLGSSVRDINSLDGDYRFVFVDETQYRRNKKRQYKVKNEIYIYLGTDNHLYIPDEEILSIDLTVLTIDVIGARESSGCGEKNNCETNNWDEKFICSDKLLEGVKDMALQRLGITKGIRPDINPDGLEQ